MGVALVRLRLQVRRMAMQTTSCWSWILSTLFPRSGGHACTGAKSGPPILPLPPIPAFVLLTCSLFSHLVALVPALQNPDAAPNNEPGRHQNLRPRQGDRERQGWCGFYAKNSQ